MDATPEEYTKLLERIASVFENKQAAILKYTDKKTNEPVMCLGEISVDLASQTLKIVPLACLWSKNPLGGMVLADKPIISTQKPMEEWAEECKRSVIDPNTLN